MNTNDLINALFESLPNDKRDTMEQIHHFVIGFNPGIRLWYFDGKNEEGKMVTNPNVGYGICQLTYTDGSCREFYKVGMSANTSGISVYIMGLKDKSYLKTHYASRIGKASVTSYCIKFKKLKDINWDVLKEAIQHNL